MKFAGKSILKPRRTVVTIRRDEGDINVLVSALPYGFMVRLRRIGLLNWPKAPLKVKVGPNGRVLKDDSGQPTYEEDTDNAEYKQQAALVSQRMSALRLWTHVKDDASIEFAAACPTDESKDNWTIFADLLCNEIAESGLTDEEVATIINKGAELSNGVDMETALDSF